MYDKFPLRKYLPALLKLLDSAQLLYALNHIYVYFPSSIAVHLSFDSLFPIKSTIIFSVATPLNVFSLF